MPQPSEIRHLVVVLGDQLDRGSSAFDGFDAARDRVWMCEADEESTHVWCSKQRITIFLSAMRHFAAALRGEGLPLIYREMAEGSLAQALTETLAAHRVQRVVLIEPGDWRVQHSLRSAVGTTPLEIRNDSHFLCSHSEFAAHAQGRKQLRMEYFYREMRHRHRVLMDGDQPVGGEWNLDADNREAFGPNGPGFLPATPRFQPDAITRGVSELVEARFAAHPGSVESFGWPVTRVQALHVLHSFIEERLEQFGR